MGGAVKLKKFRGERGMKKILTVILLIGCAAIWPVACGKNLSPTSQSSLTPTATSTPVANWDIFGPVTVVAGTYNIGYVHIHGTGSLWLTGPSGAVTNAAVTFNLLGDFVMDAGASVVGFGAGYGPGQGPGAGGVSFANAGGGGHGGAGGIGGLAAAGIANDDSAGPTLMGGGGGNGGNGGGLLRINATSATLNGTILVFGDNGASGAGGAGGTLYVQANTIFGTGSLQASGGSAITPNTGGGGGGIITLSVHSGYYFTGTTFVTGGTAVSPSDDGANGYFTQTGY